jgi:hypothetical protein
MGRHPKNKLERRKIALEKAHPQTRKGHRWTKLTPEALKEWEIQNEAALQHTGS